MADQDTRLTNQPAPGDTIYARGQNWKCWSGGNEAPADRDADAAFIRAICDVAIANDGTRLSAITAREVKASLSRLTSQPAPGDLVAAWALLIAGAAIILLIVYDWITT